MRWLGRTDLRVLVAILITALIPLLGSASFSRTIVARISATAFQPEFGAHLDQALTVYADLARAMKDALRTETVVMAGSSAARDPAFFRDEARRANALANLAASHRHAHREIARGDGLRRTRERSDAGRHRPRDEERHGDPDPHRDREQHHERVAVGRVEVLPPVIALDLVVRLRELRRLFQLVEPRARHRDRGAACGSRRAPRTGCT